MAIGCRDFALLMMEAARSLGFAARFGFVRGAGATHAWCAVYLPGAGWVEYDPANGLIAGDNRIRVGVARSLCQALPISGGYLGDAADPNLLTVDVTVEVTAKAAVPETA